MKNVNMFLIMILSFSLVAFSGCNLNSTGLASTQNSPNELMSLNSGDYDCFINFHSYWHILYPEIIFIR